MKGSGTKTFLHWKYIQVAVSQVMSIAMSQASGRPIRTSTTRTTSSTQSYLRLARWPTINSTDPIRINMEMTEYPNYWHSGRKMDQPLVPHPKEVQGTNWHWKIQLNWSRRRSQRVQGPSWWHCSADWRVRTVNVASPPTQWTHSRQVLQVRHLLAVSVELEAYTLTLISVTLESQRIDNVSNAIGCSKNLKAMNKLQITRWKSVETIQAIRQRTVVSGRMVQSTPTVSPRHSLAWHSQFRRSKSSSG